MAGYVAAPPVRLRADTGELQHRGRARTFDGVIGVYVGPNTFQPEPDEVQRRVAGCVVPAHSGTHTFEPGTTLDDPDLDTWRPWVVG